MKTFLFIGGVCDGEQKAVADGVTAIKVRRDYDAEPRTVETAYFKERVQFGRLTIEVFRAESLTIEDMGARFILNYRA